MGSYNRSFRPAPFGSDLKSRPSHIMNNHTMYGMDFRISRDIWLCRPGLKERNCADIKYENNFCNKK